MSTEWLGSLGEIATLLQKEYGLPKSKLYNVFFKLLYEWEYLITMIKGLTSI
jgi:hypothetical protein